jgi:hypothetical protein
MTKKKEFLMPYPDDPTEGAFLGLDSGKAQKYGLIVMTGRGLTQNDVFAKLVNSGRKIENVARTLALIERYFSELKGFKIGNVIGINYPFDEPNGFKLKLIASLPSGISSKPLP